MGRGWLGDMETHGGHSIGPLVEWLGTCWEHAGDSGDQWVMSQSLAGEVSQSGDRLGTRECLGTG